MLKRITPPQMTAQRSLEQEVIIPSQNGQCEPLRAVSCRFVPTHNAQTRRVCPPYKVESSVVLGIALGSHQEVLGPHRVYH